MHNRGIDDQRPKQAHRLKGVDARQSPLLTGSIINIIMREAGGWGLRPLIYRRDHLGTVRLWSQADKGEEGKGQARIFWWQRAGMVALQGFWANDKNGRLLFSTVFLGVCLLLANWKNLASSKGWFLLFTVMVPKNLYDGKDTTDSGARGLCSGVDRTWLTDHGFI